MVICKLSPIVGLYTTECEGWCKELGGVFKEIYGRLRIPARVDAFVLNPGSAVYDVVLVAAPFPVLYVHLSDFSRIVFTIAELAGLAHFLLAFLKQTSTLQDVPDAVVRYTDVVITLEYVTERIFTISHPQPELDNEADCFFVNILWVTLGRTRLFIQACE